MRIVVLSQWYQPEPEPKVHLLARDLAARGHTVTAITGIPNYPEGRIYPGFRVRPWPQIELKDGVRVVRVPLYPDHSKSAPKRILNYVSFALSASLFGTLLSGPADVMWVYHPPLTTCLPALALAATRGIPFVYEVQDMWPETLAATGMVRSPRILSAVARVAELLYRRADRLTVISPGFKRNLMSKGVAGWKVEVLPNWADEEIYRPVEPDLEMGRKIGALGRFNVLYAGNFGAAQALDNVLDAARQLRDEPEIQFLLAGDGLEDVQLRKRVESQGIRNIRFLGRVAPREVPVLCALANVLLVHLGPDPLFEMTIPSKTISYLACGKPILTVSRGDPADVVSAAEAGLSCGPGDPAALAASVRAFHGMSEERRSEMGRRGRLYYLAHFTRASLMDRYESLLTEVARGRSRP